MDSPGTLRVEHPMNTFTLAPAAPVLVVGAGLMGIGIAQVAAQAGHRVMLFDARAGAAADAVMQLARTLDGLANKGKISADDASATLGRLKVITSLEEASEAALAVEAIVERLEAKRGLLKDLERVLGPEAILASNTSSISITALANGLEHPGRLVGMHFFNPVPLMKLVEVVSGLRTDRAAAEAVFDLSLRWGKVPVHAKSTPGFIVNRIARPYYAEALALLQEQAGSPSGIDACLRSAGFRMGPCELMDLIGHDTNFAVTQSVYEANFGDKRFVPSGVQRELVDGGLLGRKAGRGFHEGSGAAPTLPVIVKSDDFGDLDVSGVVLHGDGPLIQRWSERLTSLGIAFERQHGSLWTGLSAGSNRLRLTDGRPATKVAYDEGEPNVALFDLVTVAQIVDGMHLAWTAARTATPEWQVGARRWLELAGLTPVRLGDAPGLVVARAIAMLVNEACDAVHQGVCSSEAADSAMKLGVNYPAGPFEWLDRWSPISIAHLLERLDATYRGERYRVSPELQQRAWTVAMRHLVV